MRKCLGVTVLTLLLLPTWGESQIYTGPIVQGWAELYADAVASPMTIALDADTGTFEQLTHASLVAGIAGGSMSVDATADTIDATDNGTYSIRFGVSTRGAAGGTDAIHFSAFQEGAQLHNCELIEDMENSGTNYTLGAVTCLVTAVAGDTFDLRANNTTDGTDIIISLLNFSLIKVG